MKYGPALVSRPSVLVATYTTLLLIVSILGISVIHSLGSTERHRVVVADLSLTIDGGAVTFMDRVTSSLKVGDILIVKIDTYGGYLVAADKIIEKLVNLHSRCYTWIPPGSKAVSAGALISLACRGIFMGSGSTIGAAEPIPSTPKVVSYVKGRFRSLAERLFHNNKTLVRIAEEFVTENKVLTYDEAVKIGFAKPAESLEDVLRSINASNYECVTFTPSLADGFASLISDPMISTIALIAGLLLILVEVLHTGFQGYVIPGIALVAMALYGMFLIPISALAVVLAILGLILILLELHYPGFGIFGIGGIALIGIATYLALSLMPYRPPGPPPISHYAVLSALVCVSGFVGFIAFEAAKVKKIRKKSLEEMLVGKVGVAKTKVEHEKPGVVYVLKEDWTAYSADDEVIEPGSKVVVVKVEGIKIYVRKLESGGK